MPLTIHFLEYVYKDKFSFPNWPPIHYVAEDAFELLILKPPPPTSVESIGLHLQVDPVVLGPNSKLCACWTSTLSTKSCTQYQKICDYSVYVYHHLHTTYLTYSIELLHMGNSTYFIEIYVHTVYMFCVHIDMYTCVYMCVYMNINIWIVKRLSLNNSVYFLKFYGLSWATNILGCVVYYTTECNKPFCFIRNLTCFQFYC